MRSKEDSRRNWFDGHYRVGSVIVISHSLVGPRQGYGGRLEGVRVVGRETQSTVLLETVEILERKEVYWEEG